jgi:alpha-tubulin suppressor-like RCC1 family protein
VGALTTWSQADGGEDFSGAITTGGELYMWGDNFPGGKLGIDDGALSSNSSPVQIGTGSTWTQLSLGKECSAAITDTGELYTWGVGTSGQTGQNSVANVSSPTQVGSLTTWGAVAAGDSVTHARTKTQGRTGMS